MCILSEEIRNRKKVLEKGVRSDVFHFLEMNPSHPDTDERWFESTHDRISNEMIRTGLREWEKCDDERREGCLSNEVKATPGLYDVISQRGLVVGTATLLEVILWSLKHGAISVKVFSDGDCEISVSDSEGDLFDLVEQHDDSMGDYERISDERMFLQN